MEAKKEARVVRVIMAIFFGVAIVFTITSLVGHMLI